MKGRFSNVILVVSVLLFSLMSGQFYACAQSPEIQISSTSIAHQFGSYIDFQVEYTTEEVIAEVYVSFYTDHQNTLAYIPLEMTKAGTATARYLIRDSDSLLPFAYLNYRFSFILENGETYTSDLYRYQYTDNRSFIYQGNSYSEWKSIEGDHVVIHWYAGGLDYAQTVLNTALLSLDYLDRYILLPDPDLIDIYLYSDSLYLSEALTNTEEPLSLSGHVTPQSHIVLAAIEPDSVYTNSESERVIPHEIAHVVVSQYVGERTNFVPFWFSEGISSLAEFNPNQDYTNSLTSAYENHTLFPLASLCDAPSELDNEKTLQAYAQAASFTYYLYENYGANGLTDLLEEYAAGAECSLALENVTGETLAQHETLWLRTQKSLSSGLIFNQNFSSLSVLFAFLITGVLMFVGLDILSRMERSRRRKKRYG